MKFGIKNLLNRNKKIKPDTLWLIGIPVWITYFIGIILLAFSFSDSLSLFPQLISVSYNLIFIVFGIYLLRITIESNKTKNRKWLSTGSLVIIVLSFTYFLFLNTIPHTISFDPSLHDSPFDQWWYSCDQTWYGYPFPAFRVLTIKTTITDVASGVSNLTFFMLYLYLLNGVNLLIEKVKF